MLEKASEIIINPALLSPLLNHIPKSHIHTCLEHFQLSDYTTSLGSLLQFFLPFSQELFPNI